ncbi:MAG: thiamine pyrophosphate-dependent enzyme [Patescibacteria group bacterium]
MRFAEYDIHQNFSKLFSTSVSLELFRRICLCRYFELNLKKAYDQSDKKIPIYLSLGQESVAAALSLAFPEAKKKFAQHRSHDLYLCFGGNIEELIDELLYRPTGCAGGMGGSASIHSPEIGMVGHDGLMGTQIPISVGYALGSGEKTLAVMGDASAEEGYVLGALGEAASKKAPVLFICNDNGLSVLTKLEVRRSWTIVNEAKAKGMPAEEITDDPWLIMAKVEKFKNHLPALLNVCVCRELWHAGTGIDGPPEWNRFDLTKKELTALGWDKDIQEIEADTKNYVEQEWEKQLKVKVGVSVSVKNNKLPDPSSLDIKNFSSGKIENVAQTISSITRQHLLENNGAALGQCLTAVGWVGGTVPELTPEDRLVELSMDDTSGNGLAVGYALAGRRPIFIVRYQGFQWFDAVFIANYAAKSKELWNIPCPVFVRSVGMDGGIGPVASNNHHGIFMRMPGIPICAPMTPGEYKLIWEYFMRYDNPMYVSEHRRSFKIDHEMPDQLNYTADITLFPISSTRLDTIEAAKILSKEGISCDIIHLLWLKPFIVDDRILDPLENSRHGGLVLDGDYANGAAKCIAFDIMQKTDKKVRVLALDDRTAGFAPHLDNLSPSPEKIYNYVKQIVSG